MDDTAKYDLETIGSLNITAAAVWVLDDALGIYLDTAVERGVHFQDQVAAQKLLDQLKEIY